MVKIWFETNTIKNAVALGKKIVEMPEFNDICLSIESPKHTLAVIGGDKPVDLKTIKEILKKKKI
jgi:hypothetical protein